MYSAVLPHPQEITQADSVCSVAKLIICRVTGLAEETVDYLKADFPGIAFEMVEGDGFSAVLSGHTGCAGEKSVVERIPDAEQGYVLNVRKCCVTIAANDAAGLWYGFQTLVNLKNAGKEIPAGEIRDWPTVKYRGIHVDLKGYQPKFPKLLEMCRLMAQYKINAVLLEVEDKYEFACAPGVGVEGAYTHDQFRELSRVCKALHIEMIPKLQSLGHVDYILKHEAYAHLRENNHPFQFCPRNEEASALWKAMALELIDCFQEHDYFHIGSDETANLGECPVCSQYTKAESYVHCVQKCIDTVIECGKKPIMWEDILRNAHHNLSDDEVETTWSLGRKCILNYWAYGYGTGDENETLPYLPKYLENDMEVWGASAFFGASNMIENLPPLKARTANVRAWTRTAKENGLEGVIATGWTKFRSADPPAESPDASWMTLIYTAESTWWGQERSLEDFIPVMSRSFWGVDISDAYTAYLLSEDPRDLPKPEDRPAATRNAESYALFMAAADMYTHLRNRQDVYFLLHMYHEFYGKKLPDYILNRVKHCTQALKETTAAGRKAFGEALAVFYCEPGVSETMESRFGRDAVLVEQMEELIEKTDYM